VAVKESKGGSRATRTVLAAVAVALVVGSLAVDPPKATRESSGATGATYHAMAWSLARDLDLRYERRDLERILTEYPGGPNVFS